MLYQLHLLYNTELDKKCELRRMQKQSWTILRHCPSSEENYEQLSWDSHPPRPDSDLGCS